MVAGEAYHSGWTFSSNMPNALLGANLIISEFVKSDATGRVI